MTAGKVESPDFDRLSESRQILHEAKADRNEAQKTIHILTEQREDYRKQVVFLEAGEKALRSEIKRLRTVLEQIADISTEYWSPTAIIAREAIKTGVSANEWDGLSRCGLCGEVHSPSQSCES